MSNWFEYTSVFFGVVYIILATRRSAWCWPAGIISSCLGVVLFIQVKIYAEALLFGYYVVVGFYGWWNWLKGRSPSGSISVGTLSSLSHLNLLVLGYAGTAGLYFVLKVHTDAAMPLLDSFTTIFSFIATWLTARKVLENWIYWMVINAFSIYLYTSRGLEVFTALSVLYTVLSVYGYIQWSRQLNSEPQCMQNP